MTIFEETVSFNRDFVKSSPVKYKERYKFSYLAFYKNKRHEK
jgi:hypothetical protein